MMDDEVDILAAEHALGALERDERRSFESRLAADPSLQAAVDDWGQRLAGLEGNEGVAPSAAVWDRIDADVNLAEALPGTLTIRDGQGGWEVIAPGVEKKQLFVDTDARAESYLVRLAAGVRFPSHGHAVAEECLVLSGDMIIGGVRFVEGDYHIALPGADHPDVSSETGGVIFVRGELAA